MIIIRKINVLQYHKIQGQKINLLLSQIQGHNQGQVQQQGKFESGFQHKNLNVLDFMHLISPQLSQISHNLFKMFNIV